MAKVNLEKEDYAFIDGFMHKHHIPEGRGMANLLAQFLDAYKQRGNLFMASDGNLEVMRRVPDMLQDPVARNELRRLSIGFTIRNNQLRPRPRR